MQLNVWNSNINKQTYINIVYSLARYASAHETCQPEITS